MKLFLTFAFACVAGSSAAATAKDGAVAVVDDVPPHYPWASVEVRRGDGCGRRVVVQVQSNTLAHHPYSASFLSCAPSCTRARVRSPQPPNPQDFFTNSGVQKDQMELAAMKCAASSSNEKVYDISDGKQNRCFVTYTPPATEADGPLPILFFAHGSGGNAQRCGDMPDEDEQKSWQQIATSGKFAFVCGEALQYSTVNNVTGQPLQGGLWEIPEVFTDTTGQKCTSADSFDNTCVSQPCLLVYCCALCLFVCHGKHADGVATFLVSLALGAPNGTACCCELS
jgi:hypothetical protein